MRSLVQVARGYLADQRGDFEASFENQVASLSTAVDLQAPRGVAYSLEGVAGALALSTIEQHHELAAELLGCAHALRVAAGGPMPESERFDVGRAEARLRRLLGESAFDRHFDRGTAVSALELRGRIEEIEAHVRPA
jgi:hypothetical protein